MAETAPAPKKKTPTVLVTSHFPKLVQVGRVCLLQKGSQSGKIVSIVEIVDGKRFLVDGPESGVHRRAVRANEIHLTKFVLRYPAGCNTKTVRKAWKDSGLTEKWKATRLYQKIENSKKKAAMGDLDRFKLYVAKQRRNRLVKRTYYPLLKKNRKLALEKKKKKRTHAKGTYYKNIKA
ncbi:unnamed protein product [Notodromas monacha]|uniref:Large ribosomal subunit protein eL14 n=1 Tax=Notodromas monacha TaxID=399045 RepID=A0A7R9BXA3_9CRUS|nr:unnamed protein product [Notodromas monacha]CAG0923073.1 unnamed protein product [Notodromas monacha]